MVETLEHLIRQAARHPAQSRKPLYRELLRSETFLLTLDAPLEQEQVTRVSKTKDSFPIWADKDPELGGVWVPVFPSRDSVSGYVAAQRLKAPAGKEFLWMGHRAGAVFGLLRGVKCFAGLRLYLDEACSVALPWSDVKVLSEGKVPPEPPEIYDVPVAKLAIPIGVRLVFGSVNAGPRQGRARLMYLPQAGHFRPDDMRKLVRLKLGSEGEAWMACRHFLQVLRLVQNGGGDARRYLEDLLSSLITFEMYGEAEALCDWLIGKGNEVYAWIALAAIYGKTGRLAECAELCVKGAKKYPAERAFVLNGARALSRLGRKEEARRLLDAAAGRFPKDSLLSKAREDLA